MAITPWEPALIRPLILPGLVVWEGDPITDRAGWLVARRAGLGASDAGPALGVDPWRGPVALWMDKTGQIPLDDGRNTEAMDLGRFLEEPILGLFTRHTGIPVTPAGGCIVRHPDLYWMLATLDGITADGEPVDAKNISAYKAGDWGDDDEFDDGLAIPWHYELQVRHQMEVVGAQRGWLSVLIGGQHHVVRRIERDEQLAADLIAAEQRFWTEHVVAGVMPPVDGHSSTREVLDVRHTSAGEWHADTELLDLIDLRWKLHAEVGLAEDRLAEIDNQIRVLISEHDADLVDVAGVTVATWQQETRKRIDVKTLAAEDPDTAAIYRTETTTPVLRIRRPKTIDKARTAATQEMSR